jgi:hypothetical protein
MNLLDATRITARAYPGGIEALAQRLGKSPDTLRHELSGHAQFKLGLEDACDITQLAQQTATPGALGALNAFAANCACMVVPLPPALDLGNDECLRGVAMASQEFAELLQTTMHGLADGHITDNELRAFERANGEMLASLQALALSLAARNRAGKKGEGGHA